MHASVFPSVWRLGLAATSALACLLTAVPAGAQVGTAVTPITVQGSNAYAAIGFGTPSQPAVAGALGGVTLFASYAPNGPVLARIPYLPPFEIIRNPDGEDELPGWDFRGVPPGTYYVALVYGIVNTPNIAVGAWRRLDVGGACNAAPGMGLLNRELTGVAPDTARVFISAFDGCATSYLVEAGTSPGATNVASFEQAGVLVTANGVPPGTYYLRVRGRNQFGLGPYSAVLPVSVPACVPAEAFVEVDNFRATVVGQTVTLTWTPPPTPPGRPITYYEIALLNAVPPGRPAPRYLFPGAMSSLSATVPSGTYVVMIHAGDACNSFISTDPITFTIP